MTGRSGPLACPVQGCGYCLPTGTGAERAYLAEHLQLEHVLDYRVCSNGRWVCPYCREGRGSASWFGSRHYPGSAKLAQHIVQEHPTAVPQQLQAPPLRQQRPPVNAEGQHHRRPGLLLRLFCCWHDGNPRVSSDGHSAVPLAAVTPTKADTCESRAPSNIPLQGRQGLCQPPPIAGYYQPGPSHQQQQQYAPQAHPHQRYPAVYPLPPVSRQPFAASQGINPPATAPPQQLRASPQRSSPSTLPFTPPMVAFAAPRPVIASQAPSNPSPSAHCLPSLQSAHCTSHNDAQQHGTSMSSQHHRRSGDLAATSCISEYPTASHDSKHSSGAQRHSVGNLFLGSASFTAADRRDSSRLLLASWNVEKLSVPNPAEPKSYERRMARMAHIVQTIVEVLPPSGLMLIALQELASDKVVPLLCSQLEAATKRPWRLHTSPRLDRAAAYAEYAAFVWTDSKHIGADSAKNFRTFSERDMRLHVVPRKSKDTDIASAGSGGGGEADGVLQVKSRRALRAAAVADAAAVDPPDQHTRKADDALGQQQFGSGGEDIVGKHDDGGTGAVATGGCFNRSPLYGHFRIGTANLVLLNVHLAEKKLANEREIGLLHNLVSAIERPNSDLYLRSTARQGHVPSLQRRGTTIVLGDFNRPFTPHQFKQAKAPRNGAKAAAAAAQSAVVKGLELMTLQHLPHMPEAGGPQDEHQADVREQREQSAMQQGWQALRPQLLVPAPTFATDPWAKFRQQGWQDLIPPHLPTNSFSPNVQHLDGIFMQQSMCIQSGVVEVPPNVDRVNYPNHKMVWCQLDLTLLQPTSRSARNSAAQVLADASFRMTEEEARWTSAHATGMA